MLAKFFIDRPIFAAVISLLITLAGGLSAFDLPLSQYPPVTPPTIQVDCNYPGASSKVVAETIAAPIEQRVNGVEGMLYMASQSTSDGSYTLTITFEIGTDLNMAQVLVQNRVNLALQELPDVVRATGVTTRKRSPEILMTVAMLSPPEPGYPNGRYDQLYLSNYAVTHIKDELTRIEGISDVTIFGQRDYSMRVWLDPRKLEARGLTALDVVRALQGQNVTVSLGQLGHSGAGGGGDEATPTQVPLTVVGRLTDEDEFADVVVKAEAGTVVRVRDVARVELAARTEDVNNRFDGKPTVGLAVFLLSDANALETAEQVKAKMAELKTDFPDGVTYEIGYDTTPFIGESIKEVLKSLRDSILLVAVVVLLFLQSWRAALIPLAAVPVAIVGTFAAMWAVGFGLNNLTLFGLVLSVGIVVDDAIVVVEAVQHQLEKGLAPRAATLKAMDDVSGPILACGVVLAAVFVPCAFFSGIVGQFFRQFALTIAISSLISTLNSLTLSPALAALLLRPKTGRRDWVGWVLHVLLGWWLFRLFDWGFSASGKLYVWSVGKLVRVPVLVLVVYGGLLLLTYWGYLRLPTGFIPQQDKGYLIASVQLPDAASAERTQLVMNQVSEIALGTDRTGHFLPGDEKEPGIKGIRHTNAVAGNSFVLSAYGSNFGSMFIILDGFDDRRTADLYAEAIAARLRARVAQKVPDARVDVFGAPPVSGLGRAGGIKLMVEDRGDFGPEFLQGQTEALIDKGNAQPVIAGKKDKPNTARLFTAYRTTSPQIFVKVDEAECAARGVEVRDVYATMQATLGSRYVNDFNRFGRTWQVNVQADPQFRDSPDEIRRLKVRNAQGQLVPIGAIADVKEVAGPPVLTRYNMYQAAAIQGSVAPGYSSGEGLAVLGRVSETELPDKMSAEWTELAYLEHRSTDTGVFVFGFSVLVVFLVLAALYESWALPLAVILVVPMCVACSLGGVWLTNEEPDATGAAVAVSKSVGVTDPDNPDAVKADTRAVGATVARVAVPKQDVNIFTQVGFVVLIGLACKNAILIVEFAKRRREAGASRRDAVLDACRLRYRPILMTSFAFILGVLPLVFATGAGAEMRRALGLAVFSGMLGVTAFGVVMTPAFFVIVDWAKDHLLAWFPWLGRAAAGLRWAVALGFVGPMLRRLAPAARR